MAQEKMYSAKNNSPITILTAGINSSDSTMTVDDISVFPEPENLAVIGSADNAEIVLYTEINENTLKIVRGQHGTAAGTWPAGTVVARNFTAYDHDLFKHNIEDLAENKQNTLTFDNTPTANSNNPVKSGGIKTELDLKAPLESPALSGTPTAPTASSGTNTTQIATTAFVRGELNKEILYFYKQAVSVATSATIMTITDSRITADTVVLECTFANPANITSDVIWTSSAGKIVFSPGTCTAATTANVTLGQKGN